MKDLLLGDDLDLNFSAGDLSVGTSNDQHKNLLLINDKGTFKEFPARCVGVFSYLLDNNPENLARDVRMQFNADGMKVRAISALDEILQIDADYASES